MTDTVGTDGTDRVRNVERLQFADESRRPGRSPSAPVIGTVTAGDGEATVNFTAGPDNGAQPVTEFRIEVHHRRQRRGHRHRDRADGHPGRHRRAHQRHPYTFRVIAVNAVGRE